MHRLRPILALFVLAGSLLTGVNAGAPAAVAGEWDWHACTPADHPNGIRQILFKYTTREEFGPYTTQTNGTSQPLAVEITNTFSQEVSASNTWGGSVELDNIVKLEGTYSHSEQAKVTVTSTQKASLTLQPGETGHYQNTLSTRSVAYLTTYPSEVISYPRTGSTCRKRGIPAWRFGLAKIPVGAGRCTWIVSPLPCRGLEPETRGGGSGPPGGGTPGPAPGPQPVTDVRGLPDGTLLATSDTKRIYKMVGGAPVWQSTCADGICSGQPRPTTQSVINNGPATPRNSASAIDQRGKVYLFVGGAPLWQDSCAAPVNCGTPVKISNWSIDARDHMNMHPADGALVQAKAGNVDLPVAATLGRALVPFANPQEVIDTGHGTDWASKVVAISADSYHAIGFTHVDGTLVQGTGGGSSTAVAQIVGGAKIPFANPQEVIDAGYGTDWPSKVRAVPTRHFEKLAPLPKDGTLIQGSNGATPVAQMVGGSRVNFGTPQEVIDAGFGTDWPSKVRSIPGRAFNEIATRLADGVLIQGTGSPSTPVAQILGGARVNFASPQEVIDTGFGTDWASKVRSIPPRAFNEIGTRIADGTLVRGVAGGTSTGIVQVVGGARILFANESDVAELHGADWGKLVRTIPTRAYTAMPTSPADGVRMLNEAGVLYKAVQGGVEVDGHCPEYTEACSSGLPIVLDRQLAGLREYGPAGLAWVDADGDGKADYCRRTGTVNHQDSKVACTLSTGTGYGETITSPVTDWGYLTGRQWADVNGDRKADYCRVVGNDNRTDAYAACTPSTGTGFGMTFVSVRLDPGHVAGRTWADVNGDGKADYCRVRGETNHAGVLVSCMPSAGTGFGSDINSTGPLDWGFAAGRAFTDFNGDGKADYCRVVGTENHIKAHVSCTVSNGGDFGQTFSSGPIDWGFGADRTWVDVNGDKKSDYCRRVGSSAEPRVSCTLSTGTGFGATIVSPLADWGQAGSRTWTDVSGDGKADFCRVRGNTNHTDALLSCTPSTGTGFGNDINSANVDWGFHTGRGWADVNSDGKTDYCRRVGGGTNGDRVSCTPSTGGTFGNSHVSGVIDWGLAD